VTLFVLVTIGLKMNATEMHYVPGIRYALLDMLPGANYLQHVTNIRVVKCRLKTELFIERTYCH